jgi:hypothetical protein
MQDAAGGLADGVKRYRGAKNDTRCNDIKRLEQPHQQLPLSSAWTHLNLSVLFVSCLMILFAALLMTTIQTTQAYAQTIPQAKLSADNAGGGGAFRAESSPLDFTSTFDSQVPDAQTNTQTDPQPNTQPDASTNSPTEAQPTFDEGITYITPGIIEPVASSTGSSQAPNTSRTDNFLINMSDGSVPLGAEDTVGMWSLASMLMAQAALVVSVVFFIVLIFYRTRNHITLVLRLLTCALGVMIPLLWLSSDRLDDPVVWFNAWTPVVAVALCIQIVLLVAACSAAFITEEKDDGTKGWFERNVDDLYSFE